MYIYIPSSSFLLSTTTRQKVGVDCDRANQDYTNKHAGK